MAQIGRERNPIAPLQSFIQKMDLIVSCSCSSTISSPFWPKSTPLQSPFFPSSSNPSATSSRRPKWALVRTKSELQTAVGVNGVPAAVPIAVPTHKVTVHDRQRGVVHEFVVPEDQYILHTAEAQDITLPFACRHGCCTSCAVRVKSGQLRQPEALGISAELKDKGYALLCVGFPSSDLEVETQDEDEVYWLQFGRYFARGPIERDDYALELAMADE
ncbi:unnamed protein product [Linum tenue]|uniref:2Fe-2S ferredoxin-type domain-containing protein n=1 Tax=Linum tenue TaxID=586396 RepID=A0AAV0PPL0_9ROSI|nr:unnamed protein product [Linum tenue]